MELDGFLIEAVAGRGGMGVVYKARQSRPDRVVALKVIATDLAQDDAFRARFQRESSIAAQIEHPNVIPVYAVGESDGVLYIAMRFVDGTDLRTLLAQEGRLAPHRAAAIVDAVGQALDAAHSHGLVHRDVKPANILISPSTGGRDHVYLSDFGLSRHIEGSGGLTGTGAFLGTIDYVAPEQARGERVDARTDVYSLGCVLFQALTGTVPFPLDNDLAKLYAHDQKSPPSALERAPDLPQAFEAVLARAMAKAADERYLSAGDLGRAAIAAASGAVLSRSERSVAVEAAAPAGVGPVGAPATAPAAPATAVSAGAPAAGSVPPQPAAATSRRLWKVVAAVVAVVAVVVVMVIVFGEGGGTESGPIPAASSTPTTSTSTSASAATPQGKFAAPSFHSSADVRCRFEAPTLTCRNSSGVTATLTKSGKAKLGKSDAELPAGTTLIKGKGFWEGGEMNCFPKPDGAVSCAAFNGHGFHMGKDEQAGSNPY
jgi:tRNA A-37 threonylcarbamoyl transferase component Bud32